MPRFFMNVRDGAALIADVEGIEFPDLAAARAEALAAARKTLGDGFKAGKVQDSRQYEISDISGRIVATVALMDCLKP